MPAPGELQRKPARPAEWAWESLVRLTGVSAIGFVALISLFLFWEAGVLFVGYEYAGEAIAYPLGRFLFGTGWYPLSEPPRFGVVPLVAGSLVVTVTALAIAFPLGVASATYLSEFAPGWLRELLKPVIELLAAIPSVVIGFFGMTMVSPLIRTVFDVPSGLTALTGAIALAVMALPTIISLSEDALQNVPRTSRAASFALGADRWQTTWRVVLPAAAPGVLAAVILGFGRVIGETMAVLMVTGNAAVIPDGLLVKVRTMTATIAAEMGETIQGSPHRRALFAVGAVLFAISLLVNVIASRALTRARRLQEGRA